MKKLITLFTAILITTIVFAQSPNKMSYQAVIRNISNTLVTNQSVGMQISILQGSTSGLSVYVETQVPTTNINGLASIEIGGGIVVSGNFAAIDWANGPYFIKTETDPTGGATYTIIGISQLLSVPFALHAKTAESIVGGGFTHYIGELFGGGIIFNLWKDAQGIEHGLIIDKVDLSSSQVWSNINSESIGESAQSNWDGLNNSNSIVNQIGHTNSAALLCLNSNNGGQNDWYLPSIQQLNLIWLNYNIVARGLSQISGATLIQQASYWSSSELFSNDTALRFSFREGVILGSGDIDGNKSWPMSVRAIREF
jgi:hypothetical protein